MSNRDRVAITGSVIGLLSVLLGWVMLRPNRIAAGTPLSLWDSLGWGVATTVIALWLLCLALSLTNRGRQLPVLLGLAANAVLVVVLLSAGLGASRLTEGQGFARVSLGAGAWLSIAAAYVVVSAALRRLRHSRLWRNAVLWPGPAAILALVAGGWLSDLSIMREFALQGDRFWQETVRHLLLFAGSVAIGVIIGVPLGIWATRSRRAEAPIFFVANITQTIPSLALFGLLIAPLSALSFAVPALRELGIRGIGAAPAAIALVIYSLLPIVRNTYVGLHQIDSAIVDAGLGMGMTPFQVFRKIQARLAAPLVLEGVRTASVQAVGIAAVAALIGAGGLGQFIFQGIGQAASDLILLGAIPIILLALVVDTVMRSVVRLTTPRGLTAGAP